LHIESVRILPPPFLDLLEQVFIKVVKEKIFKDHGDIRDLTPADRVTLRFKVQPTTQAASVWWQDERVRPSQSTSQGPKL
jgi:hypothetical protein